MILRIFPFGWHRENPLCTQLTASYTSCAIYFTLFINVKFHYHKKMQFLIKREGIYSVLKYYWKPWNVVSESTFKTGQKKSRQIIWKPFHLTDACSKFYTKILYSPISSQCYIPTTPDYIRKLFYVIRGFRNVILGKNRLNVCMLWTLRSNIPITKHQDEVSWYIGCKHCIHSAQRFTH